MSSIAPVLAIYVDGGSIKCRPRLLLRVARLSGRTDKSMGPRGFENHLEITGHQLTDYFAGSRVRGGSFPGEPNP